MYQQPMDKEVQAINKYLIQSIKMSILMILAMEEMGLCLDEVIDMKNTHVPSQVLPVRHLYMHFNCALPLQYQTQRRMVYRA